MNKSLLLFSPALTLSPLEFGTGCRQDGHIIVIKVDLPFIFSACKKTPVFDIKCSERPLLGYFL